MRCALLLLTLLLLHLHCQLISCTKSSSCTHHSQIMCFCKTKTVKSLRANNCIVNDINNIELGYNTIDNCEYIDYDSVGNIKTSQKDLCVVQINTRRIKSKLDELDTLISDLKDPDIIIISETWLKKGEENFIKIKGYKFEGIPREHKKGGGVGFLIKRD